MIDDVKVSIIIPVFNDESGLKATLDSLKLQTFPSERTEILVVDNGSSDQSVQVAKSFSGIKILEEKHPGSYAARNKGIKVASHSVIAFLDAECIAHRDWILEGVKALDKINYDGFVGGRIKFTFKKPNEPNIFELYDSISFLNNKNNIENHNFAVTANMFTTRKIFDEVGLFDLSLKSGGDREWGIRVNKANKPKIFAENSLNYHHARQTLKELVTKTRRVTAGLRFFESENSKFFSMLVPPATRIKKILTDKSVGNIRVRIKLAVLMYLLKLIGALELLRLGLGYAAERK